MKCEIAQMKPGLGIPYCQTKARWQVHSYLLCNNHAKAFAEKKALDERTKGEVMNQQQIDALTESQLRDAVCLATRTCSCPCHSSPVGSDSDDQIFHTERKCRPCNGTGQVWAVTNTPSYKDQRECAPRVGDN